MGAGLSLLTIYLKVASKITVIRNTPTATVLTNLYDYINETFQDADLYYTKEELAEIKEKENFIFLERVNNGN